MLELIKDFAAPDKSFYPAINWIWNTEITESGIEEQIRKFKDAGFKAVLIMAEPEEFRPDSMATDLKPRYLSREYFKLIHFAAEILKKYDMAFWLYDEGGWPSGGACTQVVKNNNDFSGKQVIYITRSFSAGEKYLPVNDEKSVFLAAFADNAARIGEDTVISRDTVVYEYRIYSSVCLRGDYYRTDIADIHATEEFIRLTHKRYFDALKDFKKSFASGFIPIFFNDEPSLFENAWTIDLEQKFFEKYGYDVIKYLPFIAGDKKPDQEDEIIALADYKLLLTELLRDNYFIPIRNYCRSHGVCFGGHLDGEHDAYNFIYNMRYGNPMEILRSYDIPGIDAIWRQIFPSENIDETWERKQIFPRYASSAARQIGNNKALSESFAVYGDGLTLNEMRYIVASQAIRGINMFDFMVSSYGTKSAYSLVERPSFAPEKPGFNNLRIINDYTARLCFLLSYFSFTCGAALYLPVRDIAVGGDNAKKAAYEFERLAVLLEKRHIDFDIIDDEAVRKAELNNNRLCLGKAEYHTVYIPSGVKRIPPEVKKKISNLKGEEEKRYLNAIIVI